MGCGEPYKKQEMTHTHMSTKEFSTPAEEAAKIDPAVAGVMDDGDDSVGLMFRQSAAVEVASAEFTADDLKRPRLLLIQGKSATDTGMPAGSFALNRESLLITPNDIKAGKFLVVVVNKFRKFFREYIPWGQGDGRKPAVFRNEAEALAGGLTPSLRTPNPEKQKWARPAMYLELLIEKPENLVLGVFTVLIGGKEYIPAEWFVYDTSYQEVSDPLVSFEKGAGASRKVPSGRWSLTSMVKTYNGNSWFLPVLKQNQGYNSDQFLKELGIK